MQFFGAGFAFFVLLALIFGVPVLFEYLETGVVDRFPTAILSMVLMLLGFLSLVCGLILDTVTTGRREVKRLAYLALPAPPRR